MLDLKKLEEKLDAALAQETEESLTIWLRKNQIQTYLQRFCDLFGNYESLPTQSSFVTLSSETTIKNEDLILCLSTEEDYHIAA